MSYVEMRKVSKNFGSFAAVRQLDLSVDRGQFCALLGPSGCGKSTLLRMIAGLEAVSEGRILVDGADVTDVPPAKRQIAMVFQSYALYPHMTVRQNIGFSLDIAGVSKVEMAARTEEVARMLQLEQLLERKPAQLSGGQRQRVAIGRALVRSPKVFLFDEPLSNLDAMLRVQMRFELAKLHQELGTTMIYVTHDQTEAMTLASKIVVLDHGEVSQVGTPLELYNKPANKFVASFIGSPSMNFMAVRLKSAERRILRLAVGQAGEVRADVRGDTEAIQQHAREIGIRPEHIRVCGIDDPRANVKGTVELVERLGNTTIAYLTTGAGHIVVQNGGEADLASGDRVGLLFDETRLHLFDSGGQVLNVTALKERDAAAS